jgi:hypothetical protein
VSERVVVIAPQGFALEAPGGAAIVQYSTAAGIEAALRRPASGYVLVVDDGIEAEDEVLAAHIRAASAPVIEVRGGRWDGERHSPVSAACRGTVAGFAPGAAVAAVCSLLANP